MLVCIDPGHGGKDPGTAGPGGILEKHINLLLGLKVARMLFSSGVNFVLTRSDDQFISLGARCRLANTVKADLFLAIHCNGSLDPTAHGTETCFLTLQGRYWANLIQTRVVKSTGFVNRGLKQRTDLFVLNNTRPPAVLVEVGFLTNPKEAETIGRETDKIARAIADGILAGIKN